MSGLVLFGISLAMMVAADLGLDPWDVLHQGLARTFEVRLGAVVVAASLVVLLFWVPLRERPGLGSLRLDARGTVGLGTVVFAVLVGPPIHVTLPRFTIVRPSVTAPVPVGL